MHTLRSAAPDDIETLARLWFDGWHDAHAGIVPEELRRRRDLDSFRTRLAALLSGARIAVRDSEPVGFAIVKGDELDQFYVAAGARGTGIATLLMEDALARLRTTGVDLAWLACAVGNERAARFYEKSGWTRKGVVTIALQTPEGPFDLDVWRYEKRLL